MKVFYFRMRTRVGKTVFQIDSDFDYITWMIAVRRKTCSSIECAVGMASDSNASAKIKISAETNKFQLCASRQSAKAARAYLASYFGKVSFQVFSQFS